MGGREERVRERERGYKTGVKETSARGEKEMQSERKGVREEEKNSSPLLQYRYLTKAHNVKHPPPTKNNPPKP